MQVENGLTRTRIDVEDGAVAFLVNSGILRQLLRDCKHVGEERRVFAGVRAYMSQSWRLLREEADVRRFLIANAAWEGAFAAARTFVVLYVIEGLHQSKAISSAVLGAVGTGYVIAALVSGRLGDRFGLSHSTLQVEHAPARAREGNLPIASR